MNFSALSLSLYKERIFSGSSSTELSSAKNPSNPLMKGLLIGARVFWILPCRIM
jgi:membrane-associated HD superfamily phosphohydrolase